MDLPTMLLTLSFLFLVPECSSDDAASKTKAVIKANSAVCSMKELNACGPNQVCVQDRDETDLGVCECMQGFVVQDDGVRDRAFEHFHVHKISF